MPGLGLAQTQARETEEVVEEEPEKREDKAEARQMWRATVDVGAVGLEMGAAVFIGFLGGNWLDGKFGTTPLLGLLGLFTGIVAAGRALWSTVKRIKKNQT